MSDVKLWSWVTAEQGSARTGLERKLPLRSLGVERGRWASAPAQTPSWPTVARKSPSGPRAARALSRGVSYRTGSAQGCLCAGWRHVEVLPGP